jgi:MFS family permease
VDNKAGGSVKSAAQGMLTLATYGVGMLIGSYASGFLTEKYSSTLNGVLHYQWQSVWLIPAAIALVVTLLFALFFTDKITVQKSDHA